MRSGKPTSMSGLQLVTLAGLFTVLPFFVEIIADGGPSHFGDPETGYALVFWGFGCWPVALICFLIGLKRLLVSQGDGIKHDNIALTLSELKNPVTITDAWASQNRQTDTQAEQRNNHI